MVWTRSQARKMEDVVDMPQVIEGSQTNSQGDLFEKLMENMEKRERELMSLYEEIEGLREKNMRLENDVAAWKAELDTVATRSVYTEWQLGEVTKRLDEKDLSCDRLVDELSKALTRIQDMESEMVLVKRAMGQGSSGGSVPVIKAKEPDSYDGARNSKTLGNFLWDMEQYLDRLNINDEDVKVKIVAQFLTGDAKMWWRRRLDQIAQGVISDITTWPELKDALQVYFSPQDETWDARTIIKYIKQEGTLQDYQRAYQSAILELPDMAERDKLFNFTIGLKPWARDEVKRQKAKNLEEAFAIVDKLIEHDVGGSGGSGGEKKKKPFEKKGDAPKKEAPRPNNAQAKSKGKKPLRCWICDEEHTVKNCPSRPKLAAAVQAEKKEPSVGTMQVLSAAAACEAIPRRDPERNNLEFVNMKIAKGTLLTMVDCGATHNFIGEDTARKVGLKFKPIQAKLKAVNSPPDYVIGVAEKTPIEIESWHANVDFMVVKMDDYEAVLGMEFFKEFEVMVVPHMRKLYIYDGQTDRPIGIPTIGGGGSTQCKITAMSVEDTKRHAELQGRIANTEGRLQEQAQEIMALSKSLLDVTKRLETMEAKEDADPGIHGENREAYMMRLEEEDPDRWLELLSEEEEPLAPTSSTL